MIKDTERNAIFQNENYLSPTEGYPERPVSWFKEVILPDVVDVLQGKQHLLDVGCAHGYYTKEFTPSFTTVTGVDFAENRINFAKDHRYAPNLQFIHADLVHFKSEKKFDALFTSMVLQHIRGVDKIEVFKRLHEASTDNAVFVMYDFNMGGTELKDDFVAPINPAWIQTHLIGLWVCQSCQPFCREYNDAEQIYRYILTKV